MFLLSETHCYLDDKRHNHNSCHQSQPHNVTFHKLPIYLILLSECTIVGRLIEKLAIPTDPNQFLDGPSQIARIRTEPIAEVNNLCHHNQLETNHFVSQADDSCT